MINDLSPNFDPVVEDLTKKIEELSDELRSIRLNLRRLKYGNDGQVLKMIDTQLHRLQLTFESGDSDLEMSDLGSKSSAKNVCDEKYLGTTHGYPLYKSGFVTDKMGCQNPERQKIEDLVTILLNFVPYEEYELTSQNVTEIIGQITDLVPNVKVKIATRLELDNSYENVLVIGADKLPIDFTPGIIWNKLLHDINTPYVFLGVDLLRFDEFINFERMVRKTEERLRDRSVNLCVLLQIREMEVQNVDLVSGATRLLSSQKWDLNCYQMSHENYQLKLVEGYRQSTSESCLVCDFAQGPIMARSKIFTDVKFSTRLRHQNALLLDLFWKVKYKSGSHLLTCPDIMSNIRSYQIEPTKKYFQEFAENYHIYDLQLWNNVQFRYSYQDLKIDCQKSPGIALSPACTEELYEALKSLFDLCDELQVGSICQMQEGTLLGAVKLSSILPWERDADVAVLSSHFHAVINRLQQKR